MRRQAKVEIAFEAQRMNGTETVLQVNTDYARKDERAFYLKLGTPAPPPGTAIEYGDDHAWYSLAGVPVTAKKVGYNFDPEGALH